MTEIFGFKNSMDDQEGIHQEIVTLEKRLQKLGLDGDCAYERAMSKVYQELVTDRKERLAALRAAGF